MYLKLSSSKTTIIKIANPFQGRELLPRIYSSNYDNFLCKTKKAKSRKTIHRKYITLDPHYDHSIT